LGFLERCLRVAPSERLTAEELLIKCEWFQQVRRGSRVHWHGSPVPARHPRARHYPSPQVPQLLSGTPLEAVLSSELPTLPWGSSRLQQAEEAAPPKPLCNQASADAAMGPAGLNAVPPRSAAAQHRDGADEESAEPEPTLAVAGKRDYSQLGEALSAPEPTLSSGFRRDYSELGAEAQAAVAAVAGRAEDAAGVSLHPLRPADASAGVTSNEAASGPSVVLQPAVRALEDRPEATGLWGASSQLGRLQAAAANLAHAQRPVAISSLLGLADASGPLASGASVKMDSSSDILSLVRCGRRAHKLPCPAALAGLACAEEWPVSRRSSHFT
jgi:hypothetical protein